MQKKEVVYDALDEYNPFNENDKTQQPAVINVTNNTETLETAKSTLLSHSGDKTSYEGDREDRAHKESTKLIDSPLNNWPPFPKCCPVKPCFYIDFYADIPEQHRGLIRFAYYLWISYSVAMIFNILGSLAYYITANSMMSGSTFGTALIFGVLFPILSFLMWFWPLYKAIRWDSSTNYFMFFIIMCAQIFVTCIQMLGIDWLGSCGFINSLKMFRMDIVTGCIMFFIAVWFCTLFILFLVLLLKVNYLYRHSSVSDVQTARSEITSNVLKSAVSFEKK